MISHWAKGMTEIEKGRINILKSLTYLVASLPVTAEQRQVGPCGVVLWSVVIKTLGLYS